MVKCFRSTWQHEGRRKSCGKRKRMLSLLNKKTQQSKPSANYQPHANLFAHEEHRLQLTCSLTRNYHTSIDGTHTSHTHIHTLSWISFFFVSIFPFPFPVLSMTYGSPSWIIMTIYDIPMNIYTPIFYVKPIQSGLL